MICFAGNIGIDDAEGLAIRYFGGMECKNFVQREKKVVWHGKNLYRKKSIEQAHFAFGFPTVERDHKDVAATQVLNAVLGGGMSSRLFKRVREELGLAYSVYSYTSHYTETGLFTVYAGVNPKRRRRRLRRSKKSYAHLRKRA